MKTYTTKPSHVESRWHVFDATDKILGRLATEVSVMLQGKHKPIYARHILTGDYVIVVNAARIKVTGKKLEQKLYRRHSDYPGGLREKTLAKLQESHPDRVIRLAVRGMLPKTILGRQMLRRLKIYAGESHPHGAQIKDWASAEIQALPAELERPVQAEVQENEQPVEVLVEAAAQDDAEASERPVEVLAEAPAQDDAEASERPVEVLTEEPAQDEEQSQEESTGESTEDKVER
jgi:large subunit ribosomal protein L13